MQNLLSKDVGVAAVLCEFPKHVQVYPPKWDRTSPVAGDEIIERQWFD